MSRTEGFEITERPNGSLRVRRVNDDEEVTKQSFRDECDINRIVKQYQMTGVVRHLNLAAAQYADVSGLTDYADALQMVRRAEELFMELPAKARKIFNHDPAQFLDAAHDPEKRALLVEAGLIPPPEPVAAVPTPSEPSPSGEGGEA